MENFQVFLESVFQPSLGKETQMFETTKDLLSANMGPNKIYFNLTWHLSPTQKH